MEILVAPQAVVGVAIPHDREFRLVAMLGACQRLADLAAWPPPIAAFLIYINPTQEALAIASASAGLRHRGIGKAA